MPFVTTASPAWKLSIKHTSLIRPVVAIHSIRFYLNSDRNLHATPLAGPRSNGKPGTKSPLIFPLDTIFVLSVPISTHESFLYCNHRPNLLSYKQRSEVQWKIKAENKIVSFAAKVWAKLESSKLSINKLIVALLRRLLSSIPYHENSLRSFPCKSVMIREVNDNYRELLPKAVMTSALEADLVSVDQLKPIPVFHPRFQEPQAILDQMHELRSSMSNFHKKRAILCALAIPLCLPVALIPVVPNVPGFYFAYRLYCHLQALRGAHNLGYLLESNNYDESVEDTTHLTFRAVAGLDGPYLASGSFEKVRNFTSEEPEKLLISPEVIEALAEATGLSQIKDDLLRAYKQESRRLKQDMEETPE